MLQSDRVERPRFSLLHWSGRDRTAVTARWSVCALAESAISRRYRHSSQKPQNRSPKLRGSGTQQKCDLLLLWRINSRILVPRPKPNTHGVREPRRLRASVPNNLHPCSFLRPRLRRLQIPHLIQIGPSILPVQHAPRLPMLLEQFQIEVLENDRLDIRRTLRGNGIALERNV